LPGSRSKTMSHKLNNSKLRNSQSRKSSLRMIDQRLLKLQSEPMMISLDSSKLEVRLRTEEEVAVEVAVAEVAVAENSEAVVNTEAVANTEVAVNTEEEAAVEKEKKAKKVNTDQEAVAREEKVKKVNTDQEAVEKEEKAKRVNTDQEAVVREEKVKKEKVLPSEEEEAVEEVVAEVEVKLPKAMRVKKALNSLKERNMSISKAEPTTSRVRLAKNGIHTTEDQVPEEVEVLLRVATVKETGATPRMSLSKVRKLVKTKKSRTLKLLAKRALKFKRLRSKLNKKLPEFRKKKKKRKRED